MALSLQTKLESKPKYHMHTKKYMQHIQTLKLGMAILPACSDICPISDPSGTGSGAKFDPRVLPELDP
jgi:hypothetical protein